MNLAGRQRFLDQTARFNGAVFYSDYEDLQGLAFVFTDTGALIGQLQSIGDADIYGAELEFSWAPTDALDLNFNGSWLDTEITSGELDGSELAMSPEFTFGAMGSYRFKLGSLGSLTAMLAANWRDDTFFRRGGNERGGTDTASLLAGGRKVNLGYRGPTLFHRGLRKKPDRRGVLASWR